MSKISTSHNSKTPLQTKFNVHISSVRVKFKKPNHNRWPCTIRTFEIKISLPKTQKVVHLKPTSQTLLLKRLIGLKFSLYWNTISEITLDDVVHRRKYCQNMEAQCPRTDLNKRFLSRPKTITAWKLIPHRSKINKNWNPPHWVPLHRFFKNWFLLIQKQLYSNYIQTHFT